MTDANEMSNSIPPLDWRLIETLPDGECVFLFYESGEKGNGEIEIAMVFTDGNRDHRNWSWWTWGGPNSGSDYERKEKPLMWAPIEAWHFPQDRC